MQELSGLDASFLYLETPNAPMHIGSLAVIEGSLKFETFRQLLLSRIHMVRGFRQRLVTVPFSLDRPYWVDDPNFNIDRHLQHVALPAPRNWKQLRKLASRVFSDPLDRSRPLWEMVFVEGLDNIPQVPPGSSAIISKIHHSVIDGVSGAGIMGVLFDLTVDPPPMDPPEPWKPEPMPNELEVIARSAYSFATRPLKLPGILLDTAKATLKAGFLTRAQTNNLPTLPFSAPPTPFNKPISGERIWNTALLSLDRIKRLKRIMNVTVNDVILAICGGALRRYLAEKGKLPEKPLVAMVPVSVRSQAEMESGGNQVSAMFLQLSTDIADPIARLEQIHRNAVRGKAYQSAVNAKSLIEYSEFIPFGLAGQAARVYSRTQLSNQHRPVFNCVITNVPGPQIPLYLAGHRLLALMGSAPILDGMSLMIPVFSYNGVVSISPFSSPKVMPDLDNFTRYIRESANELEAAILALQAEEEEETAVSSTPDVKSVFAYYADVLDKNPDLDLPASDRYQFAISGKQPEAWVFDLQSTPRRIYEGQIEDPACTLKMADDHFMQLAQGELDATIAFMQGKLRIEGDINAAIGLGQVLAAFPPLLQPNGAAPASESAAAPDAGDDSDPSRCQAKTKAGSQCKNRPVSSSTYCHTHRNYAD
ncbi:MAG: wax ester/triacylglycerol synthase family O-acyltransferase [Chloroflexota bacterium]